MPSYTFLLILFSLFTIPNISGNEHFTIVKEGNKKGLLDEEGNTLIPIAYDDLGWSEGIPQVYHKVIGYWQDDRWGLINIKNEKVTSPRYQHLLPFVNKLLIAAQSEETLPEAYGLINIQGEEVLPFRYRSLTAVQDQLIASVTKNNHLVYGLLNSKGQAVLGFRYQRITLLSDERLAIYNDQQKAALYTIEGKLLTNFLYDSVAVFEQGLAKVYQSGRVGMIRADGSLAVPIVYRRLKLNQNQTVSALPWAKWQAYTGENQRVGEYAYEKIQPVGPNLYRAKIGTTETFINRKGEAVVPPQWQVQRLVGDFAVLTDQQQHGVMCYQADDHPIIVPLAYDSIQVDGAYIWAGKANRADYAWSLFNQQGKQLTSYAYQEVQPRSEGLIAVKRKNRWGYVDTTGHEVIACQYLSAGAFRQGRASVDFTEGQGVIDRQGMWKIQPLTRNGTHLQLARVHDDLYVFHTDPRQYEPARYGLVDSHGQERYVTHHTLIDNGSSVWERSAEGKYGLVSYTGQRLLETKYDTISALQQGKVYTFSKEGQSGILDKNGRKLVGLDNNFEELHPLKDEFLGVKIDGKFGFVDVLGRLRIANRYDSVTHFHHGMAAVKVLGRWGYINKSERIIVQPRFEGAYPFQEHTAIVKKNGKYGMVNTQGKTIIPAVYERITPTPSGNYTLHQQKQQALQVGLASATGKLLIFPKYDTLEDLDNGFVMVSRQGKWGLLAINGRSTIPMIHTTLLYDPFNQVYLAQEKPRWETLKVK